MEATTAQKRGATDRELALQLGTVLLSCVGRNGGELLRVIDESGLSFIQMKTVVNLGGADSESDATTVTALAEMLGVSAASASRAVDGLVKRRLVTRMEDTEDRRVRRLELTPKGRELSDHIVSARLAGIEDFMATLQKGERAKLADALAELMAREDLAEIYRRNAARAGR
jgi:DNA-binding MarR family transcriptional regulator